MNDTAWTRVQKNTKKTMQDRPSDSADWRRPATKKRARSKSRSKSNSPDEETGVTLYVGPQGPLNHTDGQTVIFSMTGEATRFIYPYIEYYQYVPYSSTSIYKWNTRIQTVLSHLNHSDRTNTNPWIIPVGRTLTTYQSSHLRLVDVLKTRPSYESLYVCGIAYRDSKGVIPDIQLTITGTVDGHDTPARTAQKELAEEMGLDALISSFQLVSNPTHPRHHLFIVSARDCSARISNSAISKKAAVGLDAKGKKDKVLVAVVGNLVELNSLLSTPRNRATADNELDLANIDGVLLTKAMDIAKMYKGRAVL